jgi:ketosteroid isomerase-like protein
MKKQINTVKSKNRLVFALLLAFLPMAVMAHEKAHDDTSLMQGLDTAAAKTVLAFEQALQSGDDKAARALLADNVVIYEGGAVERSADEYANHHMLADIKYLAALTSTTLEHQVRVMGDVALSTSRAKTLGQYKAKEVDSEGMQTMVLQNIAGSWKIIHIHWSN